MQSPPFQAASPLTVSQLNRQVKQLLETQYPSVPVKGEISTLSRPASGHIYFTLKDAQAQIRCAMFRGQLTKSRYQPKQGDEVIVYGRLSLYEGRGDYQLIVSQMQPQGEGALQAAFFALKNRLAAEGLFDPELKRPLPEQIQKVGVVTSATGAALQDILSVLNRRYPAMAVILYPALVQGGEGAASIVSAIQTANRRAEVDVLIVGRGGGSLEDLWCFNTEEVARAIYDSDLTVVSAVGHEVDVSISDFVADVRAATPSAAAELISPDQYERAQLLDSIEKRLNSSLNRHFDAQKQRLLSLVSRLKSPAESVQLWQAQESKLRQRLQVAITRNLTWQQNQLQVLRQRLLQNSPKNRLDADKLSLSNLSDRMILLTQQNLANRRTALQTNVAKLNVLSPLSTLERGYSITRNINEQVVTSVEQVTTTDELEILLKDGRVTTKVHSISKNAE